MLVTCTGPCSLSQQVRIVSQDLTIHPSLSANHKFKKCFFNYTTLSLKYRYRGNKEKDVLPSWNFSTGKVR